MTPEQQKMVESKLYTRNTQAQASFAAPTGSALPVWQVRAWGDVREFGSITDAVNQVKFDLQLGCCKLEVRKTDPAQNAAGEPQPRKPRT